MVDLIQEKKKELKQLEYSYQLLQIKTLPYRETKKRLENDIDDLVNLTEKELSKKERKTKKKSQASFESTLTKSYTGKDKAEPMVIQGDSDFTTH